MLLSCRGAAPSHVGNSQLLLPEVAGISSQMLSYNVNDRPDDGQLRRQWQHAGGGNAFAYDSQDRLTKFNGGSVTMVYDGDGNRVAKSSGGVTTQYLVDDLNPTGLQQVAEEVVGGAVERRYVYGPDRISQTQAGTTSIYGYDAHGDVKYLMDGTGAVTDTYDYDAFGNLIGSAGTTPNVYRYQGEALNAETGLYYLRARYYDPVAGRFLTVDPLAGQGEHPYEYAGADPVNGHDPTGQQDLIEYTLLLWVSQPPRPPNVVFTCLGGKRQGGPMTIALEWLGVCKVPPPPMPKPPAAPHPPSKPGKPPGPCGNCSCSDDPGYSPGAWNSPGIVNRNNCYTYSWGVPLPFPQAWMQPGGRSGSMVQRPLTCSGVKAAAVRDGYLYTDNTSCCPKGYHPVVLVVGDHVHAPDSIKDLGQDYHWYRQDSNGAWSSKHGQTPVGPQVTDPFADARSWGYDQPCGRMCASDQLK
jgi:RHS repeat-associated protein